MRMSLTNVLKRIDDADGCDLIPEEALVIEARKCLKPTSKTKATRKRTREGESDVMEAVGDKEGVPETQPVPKKRREHSPKAGAQDPKGVATSPKAAAKRKAKAANDKKKLGKTHSSIKGRHCVTKHAGFKLD